MPKKRKAKPKGKQKAKASGEGAAGKRGAAQRSRPETAPEDCAVCQSTLVEPV